MLSLPAAARSAVNLVVDFALPPRCPGCGEIVAQPHAFCAGCWMGLSWLGAPCCACCGLPFEHDGQSEDACCAGCLADPPPFDRLRGAVAYGELARQVALKLKYGRKPGTAETMARFMARHVEHEGNPILCPVPLHRWRIWRRGYNQSALIARALARSSGAQLEVDLLHRVKATPPLKDMNPAQRARVVRGAFRLNAQHKERVKGRTIMLVDDVYTTGATVSACARILKRAGAARVEVLCWARVVRGSE